MMEDILIDRKKLLSACSVVSFMLCVCHPVVELRHYAIPVYLITIIIKLGIFLQSIVEFSVEQVSILVSLYQKLIPR